MKYIRIASDLHLEGFSGQTPEALRLAFLPEDPRDAESILVLAGDISSNAEQLVAFLGEVTKKFPKVYFVAGNHEFYRHDYTAYPPELEKALLGVMSGRFYNNLEFALNDVGYEELEEHKLRFIFAPLWADGGPTPADKEQVSFYLNDFRLITNNRNGEFMKFGVNDMMDEHQKQQAQIGRYLRQPFDGKTVVITHHLPSRRLVSARFWPKDGSDGANGGFASNCDNMICTNEPWLWIHGHTHDTIDTMLWKTRVVCNPAGYRGEWQTSFNTFMTAVDGKQVSVPKFVEL